MKRLSIFASMMLLAATSMAQTTPGPMVVTSIKNYNVHDAPSSFYLTTELGYMGNRFGGSVTALSNTSVQTSKYQAYGLKGYVKLIEVEGLTFNASAEVQKLVNAPKIYHDHAFNFELAVNAPLATWVDARISGLGWLHREDIKKWDKWRTCKGASFSLVFHLPKKKLIALR